jgi:hypothetical protein
MNVMNAPMWLLAAALLAAAPAGASTRNTPICKRVRAGMAAGKSADELAKELKVSAAAVTRCSASKNTHQVASKSQKSGR